MSTTVCCLLYGDYPKLAYRCLKPISELYHKGTEVRLACNEVSDATSKVISDLFADSLKYLKYNPQIYKYPAMRELFKLKPLNTDYVMWFDDDSYITNSDPVKWLYDVETFMKNTGADMAGSLYQVYSTPRQIEWRRLHCPWFKQNKASNKTKFATGGWWIIKAGIINKYNWPHTDLKHRGGDVLLGELMLHESLKLVNYKSGIAINADESGKESASKRRGYDEKPIGW